jgi:hypothetical protein
MVTSSTPPEIKPEEERVVDFQTDIDADTDTRDRWIDAHSVTCALCGGLADERETIKLYDQDTELEGEAHPDCWDDHTKS